MSQSQRDRMFEDGANLGSRLHRSLSVVVNGNQPAETRTPVYSGRQAAPKASLGGVLLAIPPLVAAGTGYTGAGEMALQPGFSLPSIDASALARQLSRSFSAITKNLPRANPALLTAGLLLAPTSLHSPQSEIDLINHYANLAKADHITGTTEAPAWQSASTQSFPTAPPPDNKNGDKKEETPEKKRSFLSKWGLPLGGAISGIGEAVYDSYGPNASRWQTGWAIEKLDVFSTNKPADQMDVLQAVFEDTHNTVSTPIPTSRKSGGGGGIRPGIIGSSAVDLLRALGSIKGAGGFLGALGKVGSASTTAANIAGYALTKSAINKFDPLDVNVFNLLDSSDIKNAKDSGFVYGDNLNLLGHPNGDYAKAPAPILTQSSDGKYILVLPDDNGNIARWVDITDDSGRLSKRNVDGQDMLLYEVDGNTGAGIYVYPSKNISLDNFRSAE